MRPSKDQWALGLAKLTAQRSTCLRRAVGCVLLNARGHVLATGYNGVAAGQPHCNEELSYQNPAWSKNWVTSHRHACPGATSPSGTNLEGCQAIHAEQNALLQCRDVYAIETCYCTTAPCLTCLKLLLNTSCQRIVFIDDYPHAQEAEALWTKAGRTWERQALT